MGSGGHPLHRHHLGPAWGLWYGPCWLVQWRFDGTLSLGLHLDPCHRQGDHGPYGPYLDLHLGPVVVSVGYHPARASGLVELLGQGAISRPEAM
jgi:hypothetical protein